MRVNSAFYSIATYGYSIFVSNTSRNYVSRISPEGILDISYIIITRPLSIAVRTNILFVQTKNFIHVYDIGLYYQATIKSTLRFESSDIYPSMVFNQYDNLLYISNYERGTITTMTSLGIFTRIIRDIVGVSGLCIASKILYYSNDIQNTLSFYTNNIFQECLSISHPRGLSTSQNGIYICYGLKNDYGIALHKPSTDEYTNVFSLYTIGNIPLTVTTIGDSFYYTLYQMNEVYKNESVYKTLTYTDISFNPNTGITQSVVTKNPNCINNPAFIGLINLRTIGSNPNNPIIPVTTLVGRTQGSNVPIDAGIGLSYDALKMRRKAEILKYKGIENKTGNTLTKKQQISNVINYGGSYRYSQAKINKLIQEQNCILVLNKGIPIEKTAPNKSGIIDPTY
jgi:hypothetical protein